MKEYCDLPPEEEAYVKNGKDEKSSLSPSWPQSSRVEFRNVTVRYSPDGADVLKDVSFSFDAGKRNAIVGRTGSGKSTVCITLSPTIMNPELMLCNCRLFCLFLDSPTLFRARFSTMEWTLLQYLARDSDKPLAWSPKILYFSKARSV